MADRYVNDIGEDEFEDKMKLNAKVFEQVMEEKDADKAKFASHWLMDEESLIKWVPRQKQEIVGKQFIAAARKNDLEKLSRLYEENKDFDILASVDPNNYNALHAAASEDSIDAASFLVEKMQNRLEERTSDGWTALHCASLWNHAEIVQMLLNAGANPNALSNGNVSPLHLACNQPDNLEVITLLLMNPLTNTTTKNQANDSPMDLARSQSMHGDLFDEIMDESLYMGLNEEEIRKEEDFCR